MSAMKRLWHKLVSKKDSEGEEVLVNLLPAEPQIAPDGSFGVRDLLAREMKDDRMQRFRERLVESR